MVGDGRLGELGDLEAGSVLGMEAVLRMAVGAGGAEILENTGGTDCNA